MKDKIIDLRQGKQTGRKWFDIKKTIGLSAGEKRKRSKLIKILNKTTLFVLMLAIVILGVRFLLKNEPKKIVFYDFLPDNLFSFSLINNKLTVNSQIIGSIFDGLGVFAEPFSVINAELDAEKNRVLELAKTNLENEITPYLGDNIGIVAVKANKQNNFVFFVELNGTLKNENISYAKSKIEKELQNTYRVTYTTYKGVSIASVSNFNPDMGFSWLKGHYVFMEQYFILSDSMDIVKEIIDKNY